jgi:uncharacterized protein
MKKTMTDFRFILGFLLAHILIYFTFSDERIFWYMFTASMLVLISYSIIKEEVDDAVPLPVYLTYGISSGLLLYGLFSLGTFLLDFVQIPVKDDISRLYQIFSPNLFWHYLALMLIVVPGEEIFWRGFILKKLLKNVNIWISIFISSIMYASVSLYAGEWILVLGSFVAGMIWAMLYAWKKSIPLVIVSHLIFDLFIFILFPI